MILPTPPQGRDYLLGPNCTPMVCTEFRPATHVLFWPPDSMRTGMSCLPAPPVAHSMGSGAAEHLDMSLRSFKIPYPKFAWSRPFPDPPHATGTGVADKGGSPTRPSAAAHGLCTVVHIACVWAVYGPCMAVYGPCARYMFCIERYGMYTHCL